MRKPLLIATALISVATFGVGLAIAQDEPAPHERGERGHHGPRGEHQRFEMMDTDGDGNITTAEIDAHQASVFAEIDADSDGKLTAAEMTEFHEMKRQMAEKERQAKGQKRMMAKLDTNKDGTITEDEFSIRPRDMLERLDTDKDGVITRAERDAAKEMMKEHRGKRGEHRERE